MTLNELKGKYARLSNEVDQLAAAGGRNEARLACLLGDLDQVHRELTDLRRRTFAAPTLRDAVHDAAPRGLPLQPALQDAGIEPWPMTAALAMAG
jgi:hypothetical protein